jgi:biotin/methionine sulfoxide reductase
MLHIVTDMDDSNASLVTDDMMPGVVRLATGSWYDRPFQERSRDSDVAFDNNANPNSLTLDRGASSFPQGCNAQTCLIEVERFVGVVPNVSVYEPPELITVGRVANSQRKGAG